MIRNIKRICRRLLWAWDAAILRIISKTGRGIPDRLEGPCLILAPHSDDEWIGCSTVYRQENVTVCDLDMAGGDRPDVHLVRKQEMKLLADRYGHPVTVLRGDKADQLSRLIGSGEYRNILLPFLMDWHEEHREATGLLRAALERAGGADKLNVVMYPVSVPLPEKAVNLALGMTRREQADKWDTFLQVYRTQGFMPADRFRVHEFVNGKAAKAFAGEVFCRTGADKWLEMTEHMPAYDPGTVKRNLNHVFSIRSYVNRVYSRWPERP